MRHYTKVYFRLLLMNFSKLMIYRANLINNFFSSLTWALLILTSMVLITARTTEVFGWRREQILILTGIFSAGIGVFHMLFSNNFGNLARIVNLGQLDSVLTKPIDTQFLVSLSDINFVQISRIIIGFLFSAYIISSSKMSVSLFSLVSTVMLLLIGLTLLYSIWMMVMTLTIWFTRLSNLVELMFNVTGMARYPREMFAGASRVIAITVLPLTLVMIVPTKTLLQRATLLDIGSLLFTTGIFFFLSRKFWQFALKYYTSASS